MLEFIKKNKKIILSSSIFTGISSNNIYCGCCGDTNKKNNTNNPTQNPQQNPPKDENPPQNPPTQEEIDKKNIIQECEKLIVEIKKIKPDYSKTVNKADTIDNLKALKTQLETDLDKVKNTTPDRTPEKTEKEKLIEKIKKITEEGIKNAAEKDKKMLKYLFFTDINKNDEELINKMNNGLNLSSRDLNNLKNQKNYSQNYFKNKEYVKYFINEKINEFNFAIIDKKGESFTLVNVLRNTDAEFRRLFFNAENKTEDSENDKIKISIYQEETGPGNHIDYYYCYFNENIYNKLEDKTCVVELQKYIKDRQHGLYFFCRSYNTTDGKITNYEYRKEAFKHEINENLDLTIKME